MVKITLSRFIDWIGEFKDGSQASEKFRELLRDEETTVESIEDWMREVLEGSQAYHNRALQDIINNIGERLGFEVVYGPYSGKSGEIAYDGWWKSPGTDDKKDTHLIVESKKSTTYTIDPNQIGGYMEKLAEQEGIDPKTIYGLYVVGGEDPKSMVTLIRGSQYRDRVRVITSDSLLRLLKIQEKSGLTHDKVSDILLPIDAVNVGELVGLIQEIIDTSQPIQPERPPVTGWKPRVGADALSGSVKREEIQGDARDIVAVFPSKPDGVEFLRKNNAWGFVNIGRRPEHVAIYVSQDVRKVMYFADVRDIVPADEAELTRAPDSYETYSPKKSVVIFEEGSLKKLEDPIPFKSRALYSLRYTSLGDFKQADTLDDII